ncbi:Lrp/AsnC family transcriptional regulator [Vibrio sp.]|uniref:Lrp/AsnC family transcriptional regulator n=1 Tax=Vibrio viridaestus TaxID=2487322 RepID=A0A3N9TK54_9VIBR|nr:Lrp/AsnC family transcriptional regulator [Vibrio viridaestus]MDC0612535.1 Lrp/AsnC family transcriptional regulator [Vibrio sp.]RQW64193.1 Lrp/AsnC family transcriptional regulator [Vibrio viridaestus]
MENLDRIDEAILSQLQRNARLTSEELGQIVNLSPSACQRRIKRLREKNIIQSEVAIIDPKAIGRDISMLVLVTLERERNDIIDSFKRSVKSTPEVMMGYYITGEADFMLIVTAKSMEEYEQFTQHFFYDNPNIKSFKTMVVMDRIKAGFELPIGNLEPI